MIRFQLFIESDLSSLFLVSVMVRGACEHTAIPADVSATLELCAVEAVTNAIKHAYGSVPGHQVKLVFCFSEQQLNLCVCDWGIAMPAKNIDALLNGSNVFEFDPECPDQIPEGGMGLEIIRRGMDEVSYTASTGGGNCLNMRKRLSE